MTTDEKVAAVEEFLDWRDQLGSAEPLREDLIEWEHALAIAERRDALELIASQAATVEGAEAALALVERIKALNV